MAELDEIERLAHNAVARFPAPFRDLAGAVLIRVQDFIPDDLREEDEDPWDITGLYTGIPLTLKQFGELPEGPDTVWLFREPILDELSERPGVTLAELVAHVTVHEFAHHFGWSDADIARIDPWWE